MIRKLAVLASAACLSVALASCDDDSPDSTSVRELLEQDVDGFTLNEDSVRDATGDVGADADEAVSATYSDASGGQVTLTLASFGSDDTAATYLEEVVDRRLDDGYEAAPEGEANAEGELVVLFKSPGVQARPPDFVYAWTSEALVGEAKGVGDAAQRFYEAFRSGD